MNTGPTPTAFDQAARMNIRDALGRYMREQGIGTPKLQGRIIDADQPRKREIPLSTLQRFLAGSHQTSEHHVALCHQFVKDLPYFNEARDIARFGAALLAFLRDHAPAASIVGATASEIDFAAEIHFAGEFETRTRPRTSGGPWPYPPESAAIASRITLAIAPGSSYVEARETVPDPMNVSWAPQRRQTYEGALATVGPFVHIILRNCLTRQPKMYSVARSQVPGMNVVFEGEGFDTVFLREDYLRYPLRENFRVQLVQQLPPERNP